MSNLYIITGPAGVGKSTISKELAKSKRKSVLIEGDDIYHQIIGGYISPWKEGNHLKIFWRVCIETIEIYLDEGYDVIFNYIINKDDIIKIQQNFKKYLVKFIVLLADENTLIIRDKERPLDCQMNERCLILLNSFKSTNFNKNNIIDTSNLTVKEIVSIINTSNKFILK